MVASYSELEGTALRHRPDGDSRTENDDALLERVALGDREAFSDLYDRLAPSVYGLACRVLSSPALAEEATQEVFLAVWMKASTFDRSRGAARTWILTIAHRRAVDLVRHEQSRRNRLARVATMDEQGHHDVTSERALERVGAREASEQIRMALGSLTELQRTAVELVYFGGLTCAQVAEQLQVPLATAKTRIRDGVRKMATVVQADGSLTVLHPLPAAGSGRQAGPHGLVAQRRRPKPAWSSAS